MTQSPQEKLAARLELVAQRLDPDRSVSAEIVAHLNTFAQITAEVRAIATALSEHGGGGEAEIRWVIGGQVFAPPTGMDALVYANEHVYPDSKDDVRFPTLQRIRELFIPPTPSADRLAYEGAREDLLDWKGRAQRAEARLRGLGWGGLDASEPPTPSAPALSRATLLRIAGDYDEWGNASMAAYLREVAAGTTSAPVVDEAMVGRAIDAWVSYPEHGGGTCGKAMRAALTAALSGVSAPVGVGTVWVEGGKVVSGAFNKDGEDTVSNILYVPDGTYHLVPAALTPPAAAPRVEDKEACPKCGAPTDPDWGHIGDCRSAASEDVPSRSRLRRIAAEKGEPAPRFDASEGGLLTLRDEITAMATKKDPQVRLDRVAGIMERIRRLAASGQEVEDARKLAKKIMAIMGPTPAPCCAGCRAEWTMVLDLVRPLAASTQEKGNE